MTSETSPPPPIIPVQIPEIDGLAQMPDFDVRAAVEVGDGVGREGYFDSTIYLPVISVYFLILLSKLSIVSVDRTINFAIISFRV